MHIPLLFLLEHARYRAVEIVGTSRSAVEACDLAPLELFDTCQIRCCRSVAANNYLIPDYEANNLEVVGHQVQKRMRSR